MAVAQKAALDAMVDWKRFAIVQDPRKADLIFLISANRYLGDYVTRGGPDKRPVRIRITYMNVLDPKTGASLWDDFKKAGSWRVTGATTDMIAEFRSQLEAEQGQVQRLLLLHKSRENPVPPNEGK